MNHHRPQHILCMALCARNKGKRYAKNPKDTYEIEDHEFYHDPEGERKAADQQDNDEDVIDDERKYLSNLSV